MVRKAGSPERKIRHAIDESRLHCLEVSIASMADFALTNEPGGQQQHTISRGETWPSTLLQAIRHPEQVSGPLKPSDWSTQSSKHTSRTWHHNQVLGSQQ
jgi:hypothetical protein